MTQNSQVGRSYKKAIIIGSIAIFAAISISMSSIVGFSVKSVTDNANQLDDSRSKSTVSAAMRGVIQQLEDITRDNAIWDDAAKAAYSNDIQWMIDNWGLTTQDYPLYSEAVVIEADGRPVMAYDNGVEMAWTPVNFYGPSFEILLKKVQQSDVMGNDARIESAFAMTPEGLSVMSVAPILPSSSDIEVDKTKLRYLVLSRQVNEPAITALGASYVVPGLKFEVNPEIELITSPVQDATGQSIGHLAWPPLNPGSASYEKVVPFLLTALALLGSMLCGFGLLSKFLISDINRDRIRAEHDSTHDPLSGLLSRNGLFKKMEDMIKVQASSSMPTLIYLDLDGFKDVNDSYGHTIGDQLIRDVSVKIASITPDHTFAARLGGDEFGLLYSAGPESKVANELALAIHGLFKEPFDIEGRMIVVGASIGIAVADAADIDAAELVRRADLAMYRAKDQGRGRTVQYEASLDKDRAEQNELESDLREAIAANDLEVAYQPLVDAKTSQWHGVEALARWKNKRTGEFIGPDRFIAIAERSGLIELLGLQILRKALTDLKNWPGLKVSVNVSPAQFRNPSFPEHVARILSETGVDPKMLTLEVTEGFFVRNPERAQRIVKQLKAIGISIALDDFGSGFSSIGYLRQFAFDRLKIDRSFVSALDHEANAPSVIQATVALANAFEIPVTAEGIEHEDQAILLRLTGCDEFQGYLFGKPMPAHEISATFGNAAKSESTAA